MLSSFVYLRNRIAHGAKLWNHVLQNRPILNKAELRRAQKIRFFNPNSIYGMLVAMDIISRKSKLDHDWLMREV